MSHNAESASHKAPLRRPRLALLALGIALAFLAAACGSGTEESVAPADQADASADTDTDTDTDTSTEESRASDGVPADDVATEAPAEADAPDEPEPAPQPEVEPVVFDDNFGESIAPILANNCASCHNANGPGSSHWQLLTAQDAVDTSQVIASFVTSRFMPPWPAGDLSVAFHEDRSLSQDEIDALVSWSAAGGEIDVDPATPIESPNGVVELDDLDLSLEPVEPYDGSPAILDDYRCVVYDPQITEPTVLSGFNFVPDQTEVVHHAIGNLVSANRRADVDARAAADTTGAGFSCFGLPIQDEIVVAWAPGQNPTQYPENSGIVMQPGDFFLVQIHYHFEVDAPADRSLLELDFSDDIAPDDLKQIRIAEYVAPAEIPCSVDESGPLCDRDTAIERAVELYGDAGASADLFNLLCGVTPADFAHMTDGLASSSCDLEMYEFGEIVSVFGHMHEIGTTFRMTLNPGTPDETVLLDIPDWDFDWQFNFEPVDSIVVTPGDVVRIECAWDRALIKPGEEPRYIFWSDGTTDEMCFSNIVTRDL